MRRPKRISSIDDQFVSDFCDYEDLQHEMEEVMTRVARRYSDYNVRAIVSKSEIDVELASDYQNALEELDSAINVFNLLGDKLKKRIGEKNLKKYSKPGFWG